MKRTHQQTQRLLLFWVSSLLLIVIAVSLTGLSASHTAVAKTRHLGINNIVELVESQLKDDPQAEVMQTWLPEVLQRFRVHQFSLHQQQQPLLVWKNPNPIGLGSVTVARQFGDGYQAQIVVAAPNLFRYFTWQEWLMLGIGTLAALAILLFGRSWLRKELLGIEHLMQLSTDIVAGNFSAAARPNRDVRPIAAGRAFRELYKLWRSERQAKLDLDRQIRTNAFLDRESGLGNQLFFERHLSALSEEGQLNRNGGLFLLQFAGLESLNISTRLQVLKQFIGLVQPLLQEHNKAVFARLHWLQLGIVIPGLPLKEVEALALRLHRIGERLQLPDGADDENLLNIGVTYFVAGEESDQARDEGELALRASQLQGQSNWFMYEKSLVDRQLEQGTVRWRSIIEQALADDRIQTEYHPMYDASYNVIKREQFSQLIDSNGKLLPASLYLPMAQRCGLRPRIERDLLAQALRQQQERGWSDPMVVNISAESLMHGRFGKSVAMLLANYQERRSQLVLELNERELVLYGAKMKPVLQELIRMGVRLSVDGVGYSVEHTSYLEEFSISWLKLHPSLIRQIHRRPESQLVVTSLIEGSSHQSLQVVAEGVESQEEWDTLQNLGIRTGQGRYFR